MANTENSIYSLNSGNCLHVSSLPFETIEEDLILLFKDYSVKSVKIYNKSNKTFAHVSFNTKESAEKAKEDLNCVNFIPRGSQTGIIKPISISILDTSNVKESIKKDTDKNILVKNLSRGMSGREFYMMMRKYGEIKLCKLVVDFYGVSRGYGYVYYTDSKSAEAALKDLSEKVIEGKTLQVCHLIPGKTKENYRNNIYVKNLPRNFSEEDLKKLFEKYGEIKSAIVSKDETGACRGFGFVCYVNPGHANTAFREIKEKNIRLEGLEPLYLNYAQKKDDRVEMLMKDNFKLEKLTVFARLRDDMYLIKTESEFEKELKDFIKLLMLEDYSPRDLKIKMETRTAHITMNSNKDLEQLMSKYVEYSQFYLPRIFLNYYQNKNERSVTNQYVNDLNAMINPVNMFSNFANLSVHDPEKKPIYTMDPSQVAKTSNYEKKSKKQFDNKGNGYYGQGYSGYNNTYHSKNYKKGRKNNTQGRHKKEFTTRLVEYKEEKQVEVDNISVQTPVYEMETKEEIASQIYEIVEKKYPQNAGKITGMIFDLGLREMKKLIERPDQLAKVIEEANEMLNKEK